MFESKYFTAGRVSEINGLTLHVKKYDNGAFVSGVVGNVYLEKEVTENEFNRLAMLIENAGRNGSASDDTGTYYPGLIGAGRSIVDAATKEILDADIVARRQEHQNAMKLRMSVTPRQARQWLILNDKDEALEAGILSIADAGTPDAVKQSKLMWNWYEKAEEWVYGHPQLQAALAGLGVDRDQFFAEAKLL